MTKLKDKISVAKLERDAIHFARERYKYAFMPVRNEWAFMEGVSYAIKQMKVGS